MKLLIALGAASTVLYGQQDTEKIRAAMQASVEKQKASVQRQVSSAPFFNLSWPETPQGGAAPDCEAIAEPELSKLITNAAEVEDVKPEIIRAVVRRESAGKPCAVSSKGAQGLMQIMPATAADLGVTDPFNPKQNIDAGTKFLKQLLTRYAGDLKLALSAYNAGPGRVEDKVPDIRETQEYVRSILNDLKVE